MTEQDIFVLSEQSLKGVIDQIKDEQWEMKASPSLSRGRDITLREIINYHAYDDIWVPDVLAGKTIEEVGDKYKGDLLGEDPQGSYARINAASQQAAKDFTELDKIVHLSYGDFPAREYFKHITSYRGFQAWAIARFIGVSDKLPQTLVQGLWDEIVPQVDQWRAMGVFGPAVVVPEDADLQTKLLGITGFYEK